MHRELLIQLLDLKKQATTERSHYYVASVVDKVIRHLQDQEIVDADIDRLVRELDVIWNGVSGAAKQARLCDMVSQIAKELPEIRERMTALQMDLVRLKRARKK